MKVIIVGAGIAGLAAGFRLQQAGHMVTVLEADDKLGGRAQLVNRPGSDEWIDAGTQYYHSNYQHILKLIADVGLGEKTKTISGTTRFYLDDGSKSFLLTPQKPWIKPGGLVGNWQALRYVLGLLLKDGGSTFLVPESKPSSLDSVSALGSTNSPFVRDYIVRMLSLVGGLAEPALADVSALQIRRLSRIILTTDYIGLEEGTSSLHAALAGHLDVRLNHRVRSLSSNGNKVSGVVLEDGTQLDADHVIVATQPPHAVQMVSEDWTEVRSYLSSVQVSSAILVHLFLDRSLEPGVWTHFLPLHHSGPVQFFVDTQQKSPKRAVSGKATMQGWILSPKAEDLMGASDADVVAAAIKDLEMIMPGTSKWVEGAQVTRHPFAIPQSSVGHEAASRRFLRLVDGLQGVGFCGDYLSGGYAECAAWSAEREAEKIGLAF